MKPPSHHRIHLTDARSGFTLIELLTVIAIIGILAAILIPTVSSIRSKARAIDCLSRLRQIGVAARMYTEENRGMMVPYRGMAADPNTPGSATVLWTQALIRYMAMIPGNSGGADTLPTLPAGADYAKEGNYFYMCPDSPVPVAWRAWGNYATHPNIMKKTDGKPANYPLVRISRPSQVILIADGSQNTGGGITGGSSSGNGDTAYFSSTYNPAAEANRPFTEVLDTANPNADGPTGWFRYRHGNSVNCLYVDGHVSAQPRGSLTYGNVIDVN